MSQIQGLGAKGGKANTHHCEICQKPVSQRCVEAPGCRKARCPKHGIYSTLKNSNGCGQCATEEALKKNREKKEADKKKKEEEKKGGSSGKGGKGKGKGKAVK